MSYLSVYLDRANDQEKRDLLRVQYHDASHTDCITCPCGQKRHLTMAFRCLYCGMWMCMSCSEIHFGQTRAQHDAAKTKPPTHLEIAKHL